MAKRDRLVPVTEARKRMNELLTEVLPERNVVLLRHGRPAGIVVSPERFDALIQRIEDLEDELAVMASRGETGRPLEKAGIDLGLA